MNHKGTFSLSGVLLIGLLFFSIMGASCFEITKKFGGPNDAGYSVRSTYDGFVIAGQHGTDAWIVKTDKSGNMKWDKIFSSGKAKSIALTNDGKYIVTGMKGSNLWLAKIDIDGSPIWEKSFGGTGKSQGNYVSSTSDGGYIIVGATNSRGAGKDDIWLVKTDPQGNEDWNKTWGGTLDDAGFKVDQTPTGYVLVGKIGMDLTYDIFDKGGFQLVKTDSTGNTSWYRTYIGTYPDCCGSCSDVASEVPVKVGNKVYYYLATTRCYGGSLASDGWLVKIDDGGQPLWEKNIGDPREESIIDIQQTKDGKGLIGVGTLDIGSGGARFHVVRTDLNGNVLWIKDYPQKLSGYNIPSSIDSTQNGGYVMTGSHTNTVTGETQMYLIIAGPSGISLGSGSSQN
jgi:hypothetical protein